MILLPRQDPLLFASGYGYPKGTAGLERLEVPLLECGNMLVRGDFELKTPAGMRHLSKVRPGETIYFYPEPIRGYGPGLLVRSGDTRRAMSPGEAWGLGAGWLTPERFRLGELAQLTPRPAEAPCVLNTAGTLLGSGQTVFYGGLSQLDTFQLQALVRGCLWGASTWKEGWKLFDSRERSELCARITSAAGRFLAHLGLIFTQGQTLDLALSSSLDARLAPGAGMVMSHDVTALTVSAARTSKVRCVRVHPGTKARLLGLSVEGLTLARPTR